MKRKLLAIPILILYILALMAYTPVAYAEPTSSDTPADNTVVLSPPAVSAKNLILIDAKTGNVLYGINPDQKAYPASITKILTAAIALEQGNLSDVVTIDEEASLGIPDGSSAIVMDKGEQFTLEQLLYGLMLVSGNDAAVAIGKHISGTTNEFVNLMNQKAKEWGAKNSHFANPHGFHNDEHYTTAYDMAMIARHAMTISKFRDIVSTTLYLDIPKTLRGDQRRWDNINSFVQPNSKYYYEGATGIKTGYTNQARHTLVASAQRNGTELIAVLMGEPSKPVAWKDAAALMDYGFNAFARKIIATKGTPLGTVDITNGSTSESIAAVLDRDIEIMVPKTNETVQPSVHLPSSVTAPINKGEVLGSVDYMIGEQKIASANLIAPQSITAKQAEAIPPLVTANSSSATSAWWQMGLVLIIVAALWMLYSLKKSHDNNTYRF
ncbi:D-alanyl-D-alanine carboxypeptidase family protein [Mahella sp.]|jgi:D-alanyl-D-alanine carboxypeptidase (penicillin-binding protein 5/6)|uniref:D-alanyl-D-alanine carboxypeptidase family protein n=1 Tax=Mahella sp. TaxID=2798721 RepID=UPI0025C386C6|nr:D-alanyl-D-alanine carboxypeptidase family protein [Mahella sp.]MBZ4666740.1 Serine-type D-Ala-D-Ala carboxypeptidase [Mahella sp.]